MDNKLVIKALKKIVAQDEASSMSKAKELLISTGGLDHQGILAARKDLDNARRALEKVKPKVYEVENVLRVMGDICFELTMNGVSSAIEKTEYLKTKIRELGNLK